MRISDWSSDVCSSDLRAGTTFRKLPDADKAGLDEAKAIALMVAQPSMIKRPVVQQGGAILVGLKPERYAQMCVEPNSVTRASLPIAFGVNSAQPSIPKIRARNHGEYPDKAHRPLQGGSTPAARKSAAPG